MYFMRFLFLFFLGLASGISRATPPDSIWVRIGPSAAVLFYGDKKADLQKLQAYDWNAILKDLNKRLAEVTPADPNQRFIDLSGRSYLSDTSARSANSVLRVTQHQKDAPVSIERVGKTAGFLLSALSVRVGLTTFGVFAVSSTWFNTMYYSRFTQSYHVNIGLTPYIPIIRNRHWSLGLRTGIEGDWKRYNWLAPYFLKTSTTLLAIQVPVIPTIRFYDSKGRRTWSFGAGGYIGSRLATRDRAVSRYTQYDYTLKMDPNNTFLYGINVNMGYRKWGVYSHFELGSRREFLLSRSTPTEAQYVSTFGKPVRAFSIGLTYNGL